MAGPRDAPTPEVPFSIFPNCAIHMTSGAPGLGPIPWLHLGGPINRKALQCITFLCTAVDHTVAHQDAAEMMEYAIINVMLQSCLLLSYKLGHNFVHVHRWIAALLLLAERQAHVVR